MLSAMSRVGWTMVRSTALKSTLSNCRTTPSAAQNLAKTQCRSYCSPIFDVETQEDFDAKVINSPSPVIVDFHADWCGPCKSLGPRLEEKVLGRGGEVKLAKINVDAAADLAMDYQVTAVPTVIAFKDGEPCERFQGAVSDEELDEFIENILAEE